MNIETFCKECLVKSCCIENDGNGSVIINKPCNKIMDLVYKFGQPTYNQCYILPFPYGSDSTDVGVVTDISFEEWYPKRYGKKANKKRLRKLQEVLDDWKTNKLQR